MEKDTTATGQEVTETIETQAKSTETKKQAVAEKKYDQEYLDSEMAKTRQATERATEKRLLKELGIDGIEKIKSVKDAYEATLSREEKLVGTLTGVEKEKADIETKYKSLETKFAAIQAGIPLELLKYVMVDINEAESIEKGINAFKNGEIYKKFTAKVEEHKEEKTFNSQSLDLGSNNVKKPKVIPKIF